MKLIATIPYWETNFKWISGHWDLHLKGTCTYKGSLCEFKTIVGYYNEEIDDFDESFCEIYELSLFEKLSWLKRQWMFEQCVGFHYSYKDNKKISKFYIRNPKWLYNFLFYFYYKI